ARHDTVKREHPPREEAPDGRDHPRRHHAHLRGARRRRPGHGLRPRLDDVKRLPALLCARPRILFVGINPSLRSAEVGHHFAGPGNPFWRLLHAAKLVPEPFTCEDDARLPACGFALTNICPRPTRAASELTPDEFTAGRGQLARLIARLKPEVVAFVGVTVYRAFFGPRVSPGA